MRALIGQVQYLGLWRGEPAEEADVLVEIIVMPLPLITGNLDRKIRVTRIFYGHQGLGSWNRHYDQDDKRGDRPKDFHCGALVELRSLIASRLSMHDDGIKHRTEYHHADRHAN